jgi:hypothetical protein
MADGAGEPVELDHDQRVAGGDLAQQARQRRVYPASSRAVVQNGGPDGLAVGPSRGGGPTGRRRLEIRG